MATRTINECDRCHHEIPRIHSGTSTIVTYKGYKKDLCQACSSKLARFMEGTDLEVPP